MARRRTNINSVKIEWGGDDVLKLVKRSSGEALGRGAKIIRDHVVANIKKRELKRPGGYFKMPGAFQEATKAGQFHGKDEFTGGFVSTTSLWWVVEYGAENAHKGWRNSGTGPNRKRPWFKRGVKAAMPKVLALLQSEYNARIGK